MNRIELKISITVLKRYIDDDKIVNMVQVLAEAFLSDVCMHISNDQISSRTDANFVGNMTWQYELTIVPDELELRGN